tara:strand:- start:593 stop:1267 length:675 start_codon:yes stop_codon:yes gene_type:complete
MGAKAYTMIEEVKQHFTSNLEKMKGDIIEIGSERGEGSTTFLKSFANQNSMNFYTVDLDKNVYDGAKSIVGKDAFNMTGEEFLENVYPNLDSSSGKICFAYLDNFDYIFPEIESRNFVKEQIELYKTYDVEMNNDNSKLAHLKQSKLIHKYKSDNCFILFDDTYINHQGNYSGKGGTSIPWLLDNGWEILNENGGFKREFARYENYGQWKSTLKHQWFLLSYTK